MTNKYFGGVVDKCRSATEPVDEELKAVALSVPGKADRKDG